MSMKCNASELRSDYGDLSATGFAISPRLSARVYALLRACGVADRFIADRRGRRNGRGQLTRR